MRKSITKIFGWKSENTYYDWKKQERLIIKMIEKYCNEEDLLEFIETGKIEKFEIKIERNKKFDEFALKNAVQKIEKYIEKPGIVAAEDQRLIEKIKEFFKETFNSLMIMQKKYAFPLESLIKAIHKSESKEQIISNIEKIYRSEKAKEDAKWLINTVLSEIETEEILKNKEWVTKYFKEHPRKKYFNWN